MLPRSRTSQPRDSSAQRDHPLQHRRTVPTGIALNRSTNTRPENVSRRARSGSPNTPRRSGEQPTARRGSSDSRATPKRGGREVEGIDRSQLERKLSFVCVSINEIKDAIYAEIPTWNFIDVLWSHLLLKTPAHEFHAIQNKPLPYWVGVFNKWQELGSWDPYQVPAFLNSHELQNVTELPVHTVRSIVKLFDAHGFKWMQIESYSQSSLSRVKVNMFELLTAGVMLSRVISTKHKFRFAFGLADLDDNRSLNEKEFASFIASFINGFGCAFGLGERRQELLPTEDEIAVKASRLYSRIGRIAAERLKELHAAGSHAYRAKLVTAVKQRQEKLTQGESDSRCSRGKAKVDAVATFSVEGSRGRDHQVLKYEVLEKWCLRQFKDPLALPYALAMERFRAERYGEVADEYSPVLSKLYLSHTGTVLTGQDDSDVQVADLLTREEAFLAKRTYDRTSYALDVFKISRLTLSQELNIDTDSRFGLRLERALEEAVKESTAQNESITFERFLQLLCPKALEKHINMLMAWCKQREEVMKMERILAKIQDMLSVYKENSEKPLLPLGELAHLESLFHAMDRTGRGCITEADIISEWGWDEQTVRKTMARFDISSTGTLDKTEFVRMMCPEEYRPREMGGYERQLFGRLLDFGIRKNMEKLRASECRASGSLWCEEIAAPMSTVAEVKSEDWDKWNAVFDKLDQDKDDLVTSSDLRYAGWLSEEISHFVMTMIEPELATSFTRRGFLSLLLQAHECKRSGFIFGAVF